MVLPPILVVIGPSWFVDFGDWWCDLTRAIRDLSGRDSRLRELRAMRDLLGLWIGLSMSPASGAILDASWRSL